uniref:tRNA-(Ms[2]io[6]A)-hydroxylase n=1 Tax=Eutreptiella gymnastica TaxID=73025 RepID=A0A7S4G1R0_9EUGL
MGLAFHTPGAQAPSAQYVSPAVHRPPLQWRPSPLVPGPAARPQRVWARVATAEGVVGAENEVLVENVRQLTEPVRAFLKCPTPQAWLEEARRPQHLNALLVDHANCELKAAQTAIFLLRKYAVDKQSSSRLLEWTRPYEEFVYKTQKPGTAFPNRKEALVADLVPVPGRPHAQDIINKMVPLIKEELYHFEQVWDLMSARDIPFLKNVSASRYARGLMANVRTYEPAALVDKLILGAYIEARSCERFAQLAGLLEPDLGRFYYRLLKSEARHFMDYLALAQAIAGEDISDRVEAIGLAEAELIQSPDTELRFHSGVPPPSH